MGIIAIIPARGGSKRVPRKNVMPILGKPLIAYTIEDAIKSKLVDRVIVTTDDSEIEKISLGLKAEVVRRPDSLSTDTATSESALIHVLDELKSKERYEPELVVFLQCTSPIRTESDIDSAIGHLRKSDADSLFSGARNTNFIWRVTPAGPVPLNYDFKLRPRGQDRPLEIHENGSIYVFKPEILRKNNNRLGGKIAVYEMDFWSSFEIDTSEEVQLIEWILKGKEGHGLV